MLTSTHLFFFENPETIFPITMKHRCVFSLPRRSILLFFSLFAVVQLGAADKTSFKFHFAGNAARGYTHVAPTAIYSKEIGYGFEPDPAPKADDPNQPFFFSVPLPEGH